MHLAKTSMVTKIVEVVLKSFSMLLFCSFHVGYGAQSGSTYASALSLAKATFNLAVSNIECLHILRLYTCRSKLDLK